MASRRCESLARKCESPPESVNCLQSKVRIASTEYESLARKCESPPESVNRSPESVNRLRRVLIACRGVLANPAQSTPPVNAHLSTRSSRTSHTLRPITAPQQE
eukprot:3559369-Pyramimonas_sp.AAC.1